MWRSSTIFALVLTLFITDTLLAQPGRGRGRGMMPSGVITGSILAGESGESIAGAAIAVRNAKDSSLVTGVISKLDGTFSIEGLIPGAFYLKITSLGYANMVVPDVALSPGSMRLDLGQIQLQLDSTQAGDEVVITADRADVEFRSDRTVYNVENQPVTAGGNLIDVLKNVPQVEVDINDNVSLRGSQNVAVLINNRSVPLSGEALAGYLKSLPADMVKSVEIIPNPSAKYDPEGMAGILNIVLKEKRKDGGWSGTINLGAGSNNTYSATGSLNYRDSRFNVFSSYSFRYNDRETSGKTYRENKIFDPATTLNQESSGLIHSRSHVLNTSIDYNFDQVNSLSLSLLGSYNSNNGTNKNLYEFGEIGSTDVLRTVRETPGVSSRTGSDAALTYRWIKEASRHEFTAEARFNQNGWDDDGNYAEWLRGEGGTIDSLTERQMTETRNNNYEGSFQTDYVRPIGEKGRIETGYRWELSQIDNDFYSESFSASAGEFRPDIDLNNEFSYEQQLHSVYGIYGHQFGPFDAQIGVRAEQALTEFDLKTTSEVFENDYFSLFPSGALAYSLGQATRFRISYSRRITRPRTWNLNPFPQYEDRLNLRRGNPYLDPEFTDAIEFGFSQFTPWGSISISPYYRSQTDQIGRWLEVDSNGVSTLTFENFNTSKTFGAEIVGTYRLKNRLNAFVNLSLYQTDLDGSNVDEELSNDAFGWSARGNLSWTIISGLDLQSTYFYRGRIGLPGGEILPMHSADLALKKSLFNDKASLTLRASDVFNTMRFELEREDRNYYTKNLWNWQSQQLSLNFAYTFGQQNRNMNRRRARQNNSGNSGPPAGIGF